MTSLSPDTPINFKDLPYYDDVQVKQLLAALPNEIYFAGRKRDEAQEVLDTLRHDLRVELAKAHLKARNDKELTSTDDRKAWAATQNEVISAEQAVIAADGALAAAKLEYERLDNMFKAVRKVASILIDLERAIDGTTKYKNGGDR